MVQPMGQNQVENAQIAESLSQDSAGFIHPFRRPTNNQDQTFLCGGHHTVSFVSATSRTAGRMLHPLLTTSLSASSLQPFGTSFVRLEFLKFATIQRNDFFRGCYCRRPNGRFFACKRFSMGTGVNKPCRLWRRTRNVCRFFRS